MVIGGGEVAARKIALLLRAGAHITLVTPQLGAEMQIQLDGALRGQLEQGRITYRAETFHADHLRDAALVIAATNDPIVNRKVSEAAGRLHIPVNVVIPRLYALSSCLRS